MLWTIMPYEFIAEQVEPGETEQISYEGRQLLVLKLGERRMIQQLLSTNAADFLDPRFAPGREIRLSPR